MILEGEGSLRVAGELLAIGVGDVVFIPPGPQYPHQIVNTSGAPLKYLSIGTRDSPEKFVDGKRLRQEVAHNGEFSCPGYHVRGVSAQRLTRICGVVV